MAEVAETPEPGRRHVLREAAEVQTLQEKFREANAALDCAEEERDRLLLDLERLEERCAQAEAEKAELLPRLHELEEQRIVVEAGKRQRDEALRVLKEQNESLSQALRNEEMRSKEVGESVQALQRKTESLEHAAQQGSDGQDVRRHDLAAALAKLAGRQAELQGLQLESEQLQQAERRFLEQATADVAPLEERLRLAKEKHIAYLEKLQQNEVRESRMACTVSDLKEVRAQLVQKKQDIEAGRLGIRGPQSEAELLRRKELLEQSNEILRQSLDCAEEQMGASQGGLACGARGLGLAAKVQALTDQLQRSQEVLQRKQQSGSEKFAKLAALEMQSRQRQEDCQLLVDKRLQAETEARAAGHVQAALLNKNRMLEEGLQLALKLQEQAESRLRELKSKEVALRNENEFLVTRIDGFKDDRVALMYELRRLEDEDVKVARSNAHMTEKIKRLEIELGRMKADRDELKAEINSIRGEDMLDEYGRVKPIVLESESSLLERLEINDFLLRAQAERNPVPSLIGKISEILDLLHTQLAQTDLFQEYVQDSHRQQARLRQKNALLDEKVELCEAWKRRALQKIVSNEFDGRQSREDHGQQRDGHVLYLDGLQYHSLELEELCEVIRSHAKQDEVKVVSLRENLLDGSCIPGLCELLGLCPYLRRLDLRHNKLDQSAIDDLVAFVSNIPGTSSCERDPDTGDLVATSGAQVRLVVGLEGQSSPASDVLGHSTPVSAEPHKSEDSEQQPALRWDDASPSRPGSSATQTRVGCCTELTWSAKPLRLKGLERQPGELRSPSSASTGSLASTQLRSSVSSWSSSPGSWASPSSSLWRSWEAGSASSTPSRPSSTSEPAALRSHLASPAGGGGRSLAAGDSCRRRAHLGDKHHADQPLGAGSRSPSSSPGQPPARGRASPSGAGGASVARQLPPQRRPRSSASSQSQPTSPQSLGGGKPTSPQSLGGGKPTSPQLLGGGSAAHHLPASPVRSPGQQKALGSVVSRVPTGSQRRGTPSRAASASRVGPGSGGSGGASKEEVSLPRIASSVALSCSALDPNIEIDL